MKPNKEENNIQKSIVYIRLEPKQLARFIAILGFIGLLLVLMPTLLTIFIAFILMAAIRPAVNFITSKTKIPESFAIGSLFLILVLLLLLMIYSLATPITMEITKFAENAPHLSENLVSWIMSIPYINSYINEAQAIQFLAEIYNKVASEFNYFANTFGNIAINAFQGIVNTLLILVFSIYLYLEKKKINKFFIRLFKLNSKKYNQIYNRIEDQLGGWVRGQLILAFSIGILTYIPLTLFGIKYALPLSILAAILEIIPIIGPVITGVILTLIGFSISPFDGVMMFVLSIVIQQLENNLLVPLVMKKAVGLSPVVTIISLLIGEQLFGLIGAIISVPAAAMITVIINTYLDNRDGKINKD